MSDDIVKEVLLDEVAKTYHLQYTTVKQDFLSSKLGEGLFNKKLNLSVIDLLSPKQLVSHNCSSSSSTTCCCFLFPAKPEELFLQSECIDGSKYFFDAITSFLTSLKQLTAKTLVALIN
jgi:hypothetical protein